MRTVLFSSVAASTVFAASPAQAQVSMGADIVSRYVWRGLDFGDSWSIQPSVAFAGGGFEVGAWASYGVQGMNENDLYLTYTAQTESGAAFTLGLNDYYFPTAIDSPKFFDGDSHAIEPFASFSGPEGFPVELLVAVAYNPPPASDTLGSRENVGYIEFAVPFSRGGADLSVHVGGVTNGSRLYSTSGAGITNLGLSATKAIGTGDWTVPTTLSYVLNPDSEQSFLVFGVSLSP